MRREFEYRCWRGHRAREHWAGNCIVCHREGERSPVGMHELKVDYSGTRGPVPGEYRAHDWQTCRVLRELADMWRLKRFIRGRRLP